MGNGQGKELCNDEFQEHTMIDESAQSPPPAPSEIRAPGFSSVLSRNIAALSERRQREEAAGSWQEHFAAAITRFTGSMPFVCLHLIIFSFWTAANIGLLPMVPKWDASFIILGTGTSVEAIFLSTFILISQNRMAAIDSRRADLDLQVSLLAEHEITRIATLLSAIAKRLGVESEVDPVELAEIKRDIAPETVLDQLEEPTNRQ
jgi:uncharacterized membrane protein